MKHSLPLPDDKKLVVTYRLEPGCLGPEGKSKIEAFCDFARENMQFIESDYITCHLAPRYDKTLPELQYQALGKQMTHDHAEKYLSIFGKTLDELEMHLIENMTGLINRFMGR